MTDGYFIGLHDKTTCGGKVLDGDERINIFGVLHACQGDRVSCGKDGKTYQIVGGISHMESHGRLMAGTLDSLSNCPCRARLIPSVFTATYRNKSAAPQASTRLRATPSETALHAPAATRPTNFTSAPISASGLTETIGSACEQNWRFYQKQAEDFIAPGGKLIADPKARNRAINSAYAQLWQLDTVFNGLALPRLHPNR